MKRSVLTRWFAYALLFRFIASLTHSHWAHPDEIYQTVEFANLIVNGVSTYSQEVDLHLRNQSWPFLLTIPLWLARAIAPNWIQLKVVFYQLFTGILDLALIWGFAQFVESVCECHRLSDRWRNLGLA